MTIYESANCYINTGTSIKAKITKLDQIISALMETAIKSASTDNISEYWLDDGQTKIKTVYKGTDAVLKSVKDFEKLREYYVVQYNKISNGNIVRLVDSKNFIGNRNGR